MFSDNHIRQIRFMIELYEKGKPWKFNWNMAGRIAKRVGDYMRENQDFNGWFVIWRGGGWRPYCSETMALKAASVTKQPVLVIECPPLRILQAKQPERAPRLLRMRRNERQNTQ